MSRTCYAPSLIDKKLGALLGINPSLSAAIRGYYDTEMGRLGKPKLNLTDDDADNLEKLKAAKEAIRKFRLQQRQTQHQAINDSVKNMADSYRSLKASFSAEERVNRVNMIATDFSFELDKLKAKYREASRTELCNGCKTKSGTTVGGESTIFAVIYENYLKRYNEAMTREKPNIELARKLEKVLDNWDALVAYTRIVIRQTEAIKLGTFMEFASDADESNFSDNLLAELYDPEESTREGYQDKNELRSAYASIGKQVRRAIAETPLYLGEAKRKEDLAKMGDIISKMRAAGRSEDEINTFRARMTERAGFAVDDMGYLIRMNPVSTHQQLLEVVKGSLTSAHMLSRMEKAMLNGAEWIKPLLERLQSDEELKTQFRNDLHKNFQLYSTISQTIEGGVRVIKSTIKNFKRNSISDRFYTRVTYGRQVQTIPGDLSSIYDNEGNFIWENLRATAKSIEEMLYSNEDRNPSEPSQENNIFRKLDAEKQSRAGVKFNEDKKLSKTQKIDFVRRTLRSLGIEVSDYQVESMLNDRYARESLLDALKDMVKHGFYGSSIDSGARKLLSKEGDLTTEEYAALKGRPKQSYSKTIQKINDDGSKSVIKEKLDKILGIIAEKTEGYVIESRVSYKDRKGRTNSLSSFINPCYLGDFIEKINGFVREGNVDALHQFLEEKFMDSSYFGVWKDGKFTFYNKWLEELYNCGDKKHLDRAFASMLSYKRFLGTASVNFEDFTSKQHTMDMFAEFSFAENKRLGNHYMAWYPVFITGDSGVQRYLQAPVYSADEIIDGLYKVYQQEVERWRLARGFNEHLSNRGFNGIRNLTGKIDRFTLLPFLNEDFVDFNGNKGTYSAIVKKYSATDNELGVREAIKQYMADAEANFERQLYTMGILKAEGEENRFEYTKSFLKETRKRHAREEVDLKSDEAAQHQFLMDFYYNTKFATIQQLQLMTVDPAFYKDTKDLQKRYKEIHAPGTTLDIYARDKYNGGQFFCGKRDDGNPNAIERCLYFDDIELDAWETNPEFMKALETHFGEITPDSKYKKYLENSYTDGQGYRTLSSYRKVMGMAGKWDEEMERAYRRILDLRGKLKDANGNPRNPTRQELEEMSEIMTVVFQPIKPYMFTLEKYKFGDNPGDVLNIPVQHKYAEAILIPELLPAGSPLRDMAEYMESNNIDLCCSTTVVKVGSFGSASIKDARSRDELFGAMSRGKVHELSYEDYRIQTNVPDHFNNQSQLFGTQIRKLILSGVILNSADPRYNHYKSYIDGKVNLGGNTGLVELNGINLVKFYNELITSNIVECYKAFSSAVRDIEGLSNLLTQSIINNERESLDNILAFSLTGDDRFLVPLFEGATEHDSVALILSKFKKRVNKQTIQGGSAVQVSAYGITDYEPANNLKYKCQGSNVLWAECVVPFDFTVYDENNQPIQLNYTDYCNPDGTMIMDGEVSKLEKEYPGILDMIAYRIPTERAYSMINLHVKRFCTKTEGGIMKLPVQVTTIVGCDFDVDKLYFMRKCFKEKKKELTPDQVAAVWDYAYEREPDVKMALQDAKKEYEKYVSRKGETLIDDLIQVLFDMSKEERAELLEKKNRLYKFWEDAKLPGTPQDFFNKYRYAALKEQREFITYDLNATPWENPKIARDNMLIDLMRARLMDEETFDARYTPQSFDNASRAARFIRELMFGDLSSIISNGKVDISKIESRLGDKSSDPEPNYDPSDPMTIITYNQQNQVAGKLIGIFANQNANHALATLMSKLELNLDKCPIGFCGHRYSDLLHNPDVNVDTNVAEFLAASVDAVKDPVLNFLNLNTLNADAGAALARLGYTPREIGLLFNQPAVRAICEDCFNNNTGQISEAIDTYMRAYEEQLKARFGEEYKRDNTTDGHLTQEVLSELIVEDRKARAAGTDLLKTGSRNYLFNQLKVMEQFKFSLALANAITDFVRVTRFTAANSIGSTIGNIYAQQLAVDAYVEELRTLKEGDKILSMAVTDRILYPIHNSEDSFKDGAEYMATLFENPFAYEQCMFDMNRRVIRDLCTPEYNKQGEVKRLAYYPYETAPYKAARSLMSSLCNYGTLDEETINQIHSDLLVFMMGRRMPGGIFDGNGNYTFAGKIIENEDGSTRFPTNREYYNEIFPKLIYSEIDRLRDAIPLFGAMSYKSVKQANTGEEIIVLSMENTSNMQSFQSDAIRESWEDLFNGKYDTFIAGSPEEQRQIAVDLFLYNFYKSGFSYTPFSFIHLAPAELKGELIVGKGDKYWDDEAKEYKDKLITYRDILDEVLEGKIYPETNMNSLLMQEFAKAFIRNHVDNSRLAYTIRRGTNVYKRFKAVVGSGVLKDSFVVDLKKLHDVRSFFTISGKSTKESVAFKPCLIIDNQVYMANGAGLFNVSLTETMEYVKIADIADLDPEDIRNRTLDYTPNARPESEKKTSNQPSAPVIPIGSSSVEGQPVTLTDGQVESTLDSAREELIKQIAKELATARRASGMTTSIDTVVQELLAMSKEDLESTIETYKNAKRDDLDLLVLDEKGNIMPAC